MGEADEYVSTPKTFTSNRICTSHRTCRYPDAPHAAGEFMVSDGGATFDRVCQSLTMCNYSTQYESSAPTRTSDRACAPLTTCTSTEYISTRKTQTSNRVCSAHRLCKIPHQPYQSGEYITAEGSLNNNRECAALATCDYDSQWESTLAGSHTPRVCSHLTTYKGNQYVSTLKTHTSDRKCTDHTLCKALTTCDYVTHYESAAPSRYSDRVCSKLSVCSETQWVQVRKTLTSNRRCKNHTTCSTGEYEVTDGTATPDRVCATHLKCDAIHQYQTRAPGPLHDRECESLTTCHKNEYESKAPTPTSDKLCTPHRVCLPGQYETLAAGTHNNRECDTCPKGHRCDGSDTPKPCMAAQRMYQNMAGQTVCKACPRCADGTVRTGCGSTTVGTCTNCPAGRHKSTTFSCARCLAGTFSFAGAHECTACSPGRYSAADSATRCVSCASGKFQGAPKSTSCGECSGYVHTEGKALGGHGVAGHTVCTPWRLCNWPDKTVSFKCVPRVVCKGHTEFQSKAPSPTSDRACSEVALCSATQWQVTPPTATSQRICRESTKCNHDEWEEQPLTATSDRICTPLTSCEGDEWEFAVPTATSDRDCRTHTRCTKTQFESLPAGPSSDRRCTTIHQCRWDTQFQTKAPTTTSDRECKNARVCAVLEPTEYETVPLTRLADRECKLHTTCTSTQWQSRAAGPKHDRTCSDCALEPACPWDEYRQGCGGTSPGKCVTDCKKTYNCWQGPSGSPWLRSITGWSFNSFPKFPERARVEHPVVLHRVTRTAGKSVVIRGGSIRLGEKGGSLQIGPTTCRRHAEWQPVAPTPTSDRVCTSLTTCDVPAAAHK